MFHLSPSIKNHTHRSYGVPCQWHKAGPAVVFLFFFFSWWSIMWFWNKSDKQFLTLHMFKDLCQEGEKIVLASEAKVWHFLCDLWGGKEWPCLWSCQVNSRTADETFRKLKHVASVDPHFYALGERNVFTFFHTLRTVCLHAGRQGGGCWNQRPIS